MKVPPTNHPDREMRKRFFQASKYILLIAVAIYAFKVFRPRTYAVPSLHERSGTHYWQLSTGSQIAYFHVAAKGNKKPYPIIYLHGGPGGHVHDSLISSLAPLSNDGYDIYFYDQIGSGMSGRLKDIIAYTVDRHVLDLYAITRELKVDKVILIGQSWGAILASLYAVSYPEKVDRLILSCPGPVFPVREELRTMVAPDSLVLRRPFYTNAQGNAKVNNIRSKAINFFAFNFGWKLASDEEADAFATFGGYAIDRSTVCDTTNIPRMEAGGGYYSGVRTYKSLMEKMDYRAALKSLEMPVLVLKGQCDNQPWGYTFEYVQLFKQVKMKIIRSAGHFLWVEQPVLSRLAIRQFLLGNSIRSAQK